MYYYVGFGIVLCLNLEILFQLNKIFLPAIKQHLTFISYLSMIIDGVKVYLVRTFLAPPFSSLVNENCE